MITKSGISSIKIAVGLESYAHSYKMVNPSCTGPECPFTGPQSGVTPGMLTTTPIVTSNSPGAGSLPSFVPTASGSSSRSNGVTSTIYTAVSNLLELYHHQVSLLQETRQGQNY